MEKIQPKCESGDAMSLLTITALVYGSFFFVLSMFAACAAMNGGLIGLAFADSAKRLLIIVACAVIVAFISEGFQRVLGRSRRTRLFTQVRVSQIFAQLLLTGVLVSQVLEHDTMGISYILFALVMSYTVFTSKKSKLSQDFWLINASCAIVIASSQTISLFISDTYFGASPKEKADHILIIVKVILSCLIFGIPSYLNYRRLKKSK